MAQLSELQLAKKDAIDALRTRVAFDLRVEKRWRLNELEPAMLEEIDRRAAAGLPFQVDVKELLQGEEI